jgi:NADH-quinone oxidoreductase subunit L
MIARLNFLYVMAPTTMFVVTLIGVLTALFAATIGCAQYDIKRVLAYSTVSQLGYMFVGVGSGAFAAGIFHLMTHAFFKGLLFLAAGSVMHAMSGELDMRKMGGLRSRTPITYWTFLAGCIAIAGVPGFSGFFSKDEIMWKVFANYGGSFIFWGLGALTAGLTAFYMFRMFFTTFHGECRAPEEVKHHIHESPAVMTIPLVILAVLSVVGGWVGVPHILGGANRFEQWLEPVFGPGKEAAAPALNLVTPAFAEGGAAHAASPEGMLMVFAVIIAFAGIFVAYYLYLRRPEIPANFVRAFPGVFRTVNNKYYVDELYQAVFVRGLFALGRISKGFIDEILIDGTLNGIARLIGGIGSLIRLIQTGYVQGYAFAMIIGAIGVLGYLIMKVIL